MLKHRFGALNRAFYDIPDDALGMARPVFSSTLSSLVQLNGWSTEKLTRTGVWADVDRNGMLDLGYLESPDWTQTNPILRNFLTRRTDGGDNEIWEMHRPTKASVANRWARILGAGWFFPNTLSHYLYGVERPEGMPLVVIPFGSMDVLRSENEPDLPGSVAHRFSALTMAELSGDGLTDLVLARAAGHGCQLAGLISPGFAPQGFSVVNETWAERILYESPEECPVSLTPTDINGDGVADFIFSRPRDVANPRAPVVIVANEEPKRRKFELVGGSLRFEQDRVKPQYMDVDRDGLVDVILMETKDFDPNSAMLQAEFFINQGSKRDDPSTYEHPFQHVERRS